MKKKKKSKREKRKKEKKNNEDRGLEEKSRLERRASKMKKSEKLKKKRTRIAVADKSESEEEEPVRKKPKVEKQDEEFVEVQFRFFKVGKSSPAKEFETLMQSPLHLTLDALRKELLATQIGGLDIVRKMPAYDISIYVQKDEKQLAAKTPEQWRVVSRLLLDPNCSLLGELLFAALHFCLLHVILKAFIITLHVSQTTIRCLRFSEN